MLELSRFPGLSRSRSLFQDLTILENVTIKSHEVSQGTNKACFLSYSLSFFNVLTIKQNFSFIEFAHKYQNTFLNYMVTQYSNQLTHKGSLMMQKIILDKYLWEKKTFILHTKKCILVSKHTWKEYSHSCR